MSNDTEQRKLAAIMFTDMVGYSALAQRNEKLALELLEEHRRLLRGFFPRFGGREVETTGDGFLVEFASALEAARCAIEIQRALATRNLSVTPERQFHVRIGIHVGDVIHKDGHVLGDGVNIAARLQPLAEPGGICISVDVERQIRNTIEASLVRLGATELKNIQAPMELFRVVLPWEKAESSSGERKAAERREKRIRPTIVATVTILFLVGAAWFLHEFSIRHKLATMPSLVSKGRAKGPMRIDSIAVLPLRNLSGDPAQEFFADGMTEELITELTQIRALRVISSTSTLQYRKSPKKLPDIARELNVDAVVEGSVLRDGQKVRITAQLIHAPTDQHLWARSYTRDTRDVLALQAEVALAIAHEIQAQLTPQEKMRLTRARTVDPEAHELCLKGRYYWNKATWTNGLVAIEYLKQAVAKDPNYALAYAHLADAYRTSALPTRQAQPLQREAASKALALDDTLAEAHIQVAYVKLNQDWDWAGAERGFQQAIQLNPNYSFAYDEYAFYLVRVGRFDEAIAAGKKALQLDPLSLFINGDLAREYLWARQYDQTIKQARKTLALQNDFEEALSTLALSLAQKGNFVEAIAAIQKAAELDPHPRELVWLGVVYAVAGKRDESLAILDRIKEQLTQNPEYAGLIAGIYAALGNKDQAFTWLQKGLEERAESLLWLKAMPWWDSIRSDPRFTELLKKVGLEK